METNDFRKKLIISADDFDSDQNAKSNILQLAELGKLDRIGVITNEYFSDEEIRRLIGSGVKIDIHLVTAADKDNHHKYGESVLKRSFLFILQYFSGNFSVPKIEQAWENQIAEFKEKFDRKPDGINSHQYIHYFPPYFKTFLKLAKKHDIAYVRFGKKSFLKNRATNVYRILYLLQKKNKRAFHASALQSSDYMTSLDWIYDFERFVKMLPEGKTELVCHPERKEEFELMQKYF